MAEFFSSQKITERLEIVRQAYSDENQITAYNYAKRLKLTYGKYAYYEKGKGLPPIDLLTAVSELTGASLTWLISGQGNPSQQDDPYAIKAIHLATEQHGYAATIDEIREDVMQQLIEEIQRLATEVVAIKEELRKVQEENAVLRAAWDTEWDTKPPNRGVSRSTKDNGHPR